MSAAAHYASTTSTGRYRWWHGALFFGAVTAVSALATRRRQGNPKSLYQQEHLPVWAPPAAAFPVVWPLNNLVLVTGSLRLLNNPGLPYRRELLALQAVLWADFLTYGIVYFRWRSPILSAVWTLTDAAAAATSLVLARRTGDQRLTLAYLPITAWTSFASTIALYDALRNPDRFFGTAAPLAHPPIATLEK